VRTASVRLRSKIAAGLALAAVAAAAFWLKALADTAVSAPPLVVPGLSSSGHYQPDEASLNTHPVPPWFEDAKFGVFIHWGLFSIPGFAPRGRFEDVLTHDYGRAMLVHPYAEDYWNAIKDDTTPSAAFHRAHYGAMPYQGFKPMFMSRLALWNPDAWALTFASAGAKYVVLVVKYHDGFCLWPSTIPNPHQARWSSERDLVGELAKAVRAHGMRFGVYYSGGVDWTFRPRISRTLGDYSGSTPGADYPAYADAQVRELIARYRPDILWNDISWPTTRASLFRLFADYYNVLPDGVVNDRWSEATALSLLMRLKPSRMAFDLLVAQAFAHNPDAIRDISPPAIPHSDYTTPEYTQYADIQAKKWETTRAIGNSFGYNRNETDADYAPARLLLTNFIDAVSKNGNLLLNVGPRGEDMEIPGEQVSRLRVFGDWLSRNGQAIYSTRPWTHAAATTAEGLQIRFTQGAGAVNVIPLGEVSGTTLTIKGVALHGDGVVLATGGRATARVVGSDTVLTMEAALDRVFAPAISLRLE
jgi:alpha-L-fucosidase